MSERFGDGEPTPKSNPKFLADLRKEVESEKAFNDLKDVLSNLGINDYYINKQDGSFNVKPDIKIKVVEPLFPNQPNGFKVFKGGQELNGKGDVRIDKMFQIFDKDDLKTILQKCIPSGSPEVQRGMNISQSARNELNRLSISLVKGDDGFNRLVNISNYNISFDGKVYDGATTNLKLDPSTQNIDFRNLTFYIKEANSTVEVKILEKLNNGNNLEKNKKGLINTLSELGITNDKITITSDNSINVKVRSYPNVLDFSISVNDSGYMVNEGGKMLKSDGSWRQYEGKSTPPIPVSLQTLKQSIQSHLFRR